MLIGVIQIECCTSSRRQEEIPCFVSHGRNLNLAVFRAVVVDVAVDSRESLLLLLRRRRRLLLLLLLNMVALSLCYVAMFLWTTVAFTSLVRGETVGCTFRYLISYSPRALNVWIPLPSCITNPSARTAHRCLCSSLSPSFRRAVARRNKSEHSLVRHQRLLSVEHPLINATRIPRHLIISACINSSIALTWSCRIFFSSQECCGEFTGRSRMR